MTRRETTLLVTHRHPAKSASTARAETRGIGFRSSGGRWAGRRRCRPQADWFAANLCVEPATNTPSADLARFEPHEASTKSSDGRQGDFVVRKSTPYRGGSPGTGVDFAKPNGRHRSEMRPSSS